MKRDFIDKYHGKKNLLEEFYLRAKIGIIVTSELIDMRNLKFINDNIERIKLTIGVKDAINLINEVSIENASYVINSVEVDSGFYDVSSLAANVLLSRIESCSQVDVTHLPESINERYGELVKNNVVMDKIEMGLPLTFFECATLKNEEIGLLPVSYLPTILQELVSENKSLNMREVALILQKLETGMSFNINDILGLPDSKVLQEKLQDVPVDIGISEFLLSTDLSAQQLFGLKNVVGDKQILEDLINGTLNYEEIHELLIKTDSTIDKAITRCINNSSLAFFKTFGTDELVVNKLKSLVREIDDVELFKNIILTFDEELVDSDKDLLNYLWKWNNSKSASMFDSEYRAKLEQFILAQKGVSTDANIMKQSSFYSGIPITVSEEAGLSFYTTVVIDRLSDYFYKREEVSTTKNEESIKILRKIVKGNEAKFQKLFDYFTVGNIWDMTILSTGYEEDVRTRTEYNEIINFNDNFNNSLVMMVANTDFSNQEEINKLKQNINLRLCASKLLEMDETRMKTGFELLFGTSFDGIVCENQSESSLRFVLGHAPIILSDWINFYREHNELNGVANKIDLDLVARVNPSMIESVYNSSEAYSKFAQEFLQNMGCDNIYEEMQYRKILNGLAISFDYFNSEDKKSIENRINEVVSNVMSSMGTASEEVMSNIWYAKEQKRQNLNILSVLFESITSKNNSEYLNNLQTNYSLICGKDIYRYASVVGKESLDWFGKISKSKLGLGVCSVEEMWNLNTLKYDNMAINSSGAAAVMLQNGIYYNVFQELQEYYLTALERNGSSVPYIAGNRGTYSYELLRQWDSYLMYFDAENKFVNCPIELKKSLMISDDMRLLVVKNSDGEVVGNIVVERNQEKIRFNGLAGGRLPDGEVKEILTDVSVDIDRVVTASDDFIGTYTSESSFGDMELLSRERKTTDEVITETKKYKDPPKKYRNLELCSDLPEKYRIQRLHSRAFIQDAVYHSSINSIMDGLRFQTYDSAADFSVGRDWYMLTASQDEETTVLYYMARFNENPSSLLGQAELRDMISEFINGCDKKISMTAFPSSYYNLARMAMDGAILIHDDNFVKASGEGPNASVENLNQYIVNGVVNESFGGGRHNNLRNYGEQGLYGDEEFNKVLFTRPPDNPTDVEKERIEKQKSIYAQVVEQYDNIREKARKKDSCYDIPLSQEEIARAGSLHINPGGINYTRYKLSKSALGSMGIVESHDMYRSSTKI